MYEKQIVKFKAGKYNIPGSLQKLDSGPIEVRFRYNKILLEEIKAFEGSRWNPDDKCWTIKDSLRNKFQLEYLIAFREINGELVKGGDPYSWYDRPLMEIESTRPLRPHQTRMASQGLTYRRTILAAEMGTGKSLAAITIMELSGFSDWYWVAPRSALRSVELELEKWNCKIRPSLYTYEGLTKLMQNWPAGKKAPHGIIGDESSRAKSPTAKRSQATYELACGIRQDWDNDGYVILMSGTPAPKSPADWWMQCEITQPGFLREGTYEKFKRRLGLIVEKESIQGGVYPHLVTWKDDANKCDQCGLMQGDPCHRPDGAMFGATEAYHGFVASVNEVADLYERMAGLVIVIFKKDCLELPDKIYDVIRLKPSSSTLRAAAIITAKSTSAATAMVLCRELSDGFQYEEEETGTEKCPVCFGKGEIEMHLACPDVEVEITEDNVEEYKDTGLSVGDTYTMPRSQIDDAQTDTELTSCPKCGGAGEIVTYKRIAVQVPCPKEDAVKDLLDEYEDVGRTVFFAGFAGSIDRLVTIGQKEKWNIIRVDGRGWWTDLPGIINPLDMLKIFQAPSEKHPRVMFIGQAGAAGMGLTLTASPVIVYYSNDFNGESRTQSEDRIHRMGMDVNRGARIIDLIHLPTDEIALNNLKKKRKLELMTMGELREAMSHVRVGEDRKL